MYLILFIFFFPQWWHKFFILFDLCTICSGGWIKIVQQSIVSPRSWWRSSNSVEHFNSGIAHTKATGFYKNEMNKKKENTKYVHRILFIEPFVVCWTMNKYLRIQRSACQIVTFLFTIAIHCMCCVMHWMPTFCFIVVSVCVCLCVANEIKWGKKKQINLWISRQKVEILPSKSHDLLIACDVLIIEEPKRNRNIDYSQQWTRKCSVSGAWEKNEDNKTSTATIR